ncbi:helix-turn-helix transcriptional regulator [Variovorax sp. E3]|uniref:LexA family transcriptional regulator n=1 Tax=Variovorax sp. E3 TaxID=1914993 RepID=UPI0018DBC2F3|nr:helix-turn-helix transcriptional regulator [Variovorax sp. E3]
MAEELELTGTDVAAKTGIPYSTYRAYTSGQRAPSAEFLASIFSVFGYSLTWVLTGIGSRCSDKAPASPGSLDDEFVVIRQHEDVAASAGAGATNSDHADIGGLSFSRRWLAKRGLNPAQCEVINVTGDSMQGRLNDGDKVLVDVSDRTPKSGRAYVLLQGEELLVKYCQLLPDGLLRVSSENPQYPTYDIDLARTPGVSIVGRVRASTHEW